MEGIKKNTVLDLFSGAGGLSEGFWQNDFDVVAHIEMDKDACETLKTRAIYHQLKSTNQLDCYYSYAKGSLSREELVLEHQLQDVMSSVVNAEINSKTYDGLLKKIQDRLGARQLDGVIGGPPCQAYSNIGRARDKNGMVGDKRNHLYKFYLRFLKDLDPNFFVFENVPGIFSAGKGRYLKDMMKGMRALGYLVPTPQAINMADYNIPQNRKRVIVVGWKPSLDLNIDALFRKPEHIEFTVGDFISDLKPLKAGGGSKLSEYEYCSKTLLEMGIVGGMDVVTDHISRPNNMRDKAIYKIAVKKLLKGERLNYNDLPDNLKTHKNRSGFLDRFKVVPIEARAAQTVVAHISKDGHYYIHPDLKQNRSLSVREAARLQTFSDDYKFEGSRTAMFKQIGNAVPPLFAAQLAHKISMQVSSIVLKKTA